MAAPAAAAQFRADDRDEFDTRHVDEGLEPSPRGEHRLYL